MKDIRILDLLVSSSTAIQRMAVFVFLLVASQISLAQVEIVESYPTVRGNSDRPSNQTNIPDNRNNPPLSDSTNGSIRPITEIQDSGPLSTASPGANADFYAQYQQLQLEVSQLRGMAEELTNEVKKLKQQRLDDYVELDKRIAELSNGNGGGRSTATVAPSTNRPTGTTNNSTSNNTSTASTGANEVDSYKSALNKLLQSKDYDGAIVAFKQHLQQFPTGQYQVNVLFWLGQIYVIQGNTTEAESSYSKLIETFPDHTKAWEARFALGKIYFQKGDKAQATQTLQEVVSSGSDVASLARSYMQDNAL